MPVSPKEPSSSQIQTRFEIKSAQLPLVALILKTSDWDVLAIDLLNQYGVNGETPDFFENDPLVIDFSQLDAELESETPLKNLVPLIKTLRQCRLIAVAVRGASEAWTQGAHALGLVNAPADVPRPRSASTLVETSTTAVREIVREVPGPITMVIDRPLRSGQKIYARGADLIVLAMVNQGAEVVADGNIHVYAPLRGKAMAGASGNTNARIFSLFLEPELISIAGVYRTSENPLPLEIRGKAAQVRLSSDGQEKLLIEALKS